MHICLLGGTGFVGTALTHRLVSQGYTVTRTVRRLSNETKPVFESPLFRDVVWDGHNAETLQPLLTDVDVIINLIGANIGSKRWTPSRKQAIVQSRVRSATAVCTALRLLAETGQIRPHTLIHASAVGYYGVWENTEDAPLCTEDSVQGEGFLAEVCEQWETAHRGAEEFGLRRCVLRFAPILGQGADGKVGGFLQQMILPFKAFVGGVVGTGAQPFAWVHLNDVLEVIVLLLERNTLHGVFNVVAPQDADNPTTARVLAKTLGMVLHRPTFVPMPAPLLRVLLGEMADELLLAGQRVAPTRLQEAGYIFRFTALEEALSVTIQTN